MPLAPADKIPPDPAYASAHRAQMRARKRRLKRPVTPAQGDAEPQPPKQRSPSQRAGDDAEDQALRHLERAGLTLVARNVACRAGEIDLIMLHGGILVFVEVRSRDQTRYGGAAASVGHAKQRRLVQAAQFFLKTQWRAALPRCRFDVVAFEHAELHWIRDAFQARTY